MKRIAVLGASGHASVVIDIVEKAGQASIIGIIDRERPKGTTFLGYTVLGSELEIASLAIDYALEGLVIAVGDNVSRFQAWQRISSLTGERIGLLSAVHPSAQIARDVNLGPGTVAMAGVVVNTAARIGTGCILNTNSSVDHDCVLEDFSSLGPGATIGGNVQIGKCTAISLGAKIIHGIRIGDHTVVGAGATVVRDLPGGVVAYGTPARRIRDRSPGDSYLSSSTISKAGL